MVDDSVSFAPERKSFWSRMSLSRAPAPVRRARADSETRANVRSAVTVMLIAFGVFLLLDSEGLRHVARDLPGNAVSDALVAAADRWHALMQSIGFASLAPAVRRAFDVLHGIGW